MPSLHDRPSARRGVAVAAATLVAVAAVSVSPTLGGDAAAHTDLDHTIPAADERVVEPVSVITVAFSDAVTVVGAGFEVFTPDEVVVRPVVTTTDDTVFLLELDPPLAGGSVGVRYEVAAADGHVIDGAFSFTVDAAAPPSTPAPTVPPAPATEPATSPARTVPATAPTTVPPASGPVVASTVTTQPATSAVGTVPEVADDGESSGTAVLIGLGVAVAAGAGAVALVRSRRRTGP